MTAKLWYYICFHNDNLAHADHDFIEQEKAREEGQRLFEYGKVIEGNTVEFTRVSVVSEDHEIAIDIKRYGREE